MNDLKLGTTNQTSNFEDHRKLGDAALDAVVGGTKAKGSASFFEALAQAWGNALDEKAARIQQ
jgi:hypothetical protein